ncbi:unnamed protein product [Musa acuminata subsp. malaccensis]|uniref:WAT1-related protein n=1 Tax=Musa acuminata subsp. malaccensis TaxID=214687 RepID=A0A804JIJ7_MUSAM|nr:PREDICTED: WAT1-related protein At5g64700-like isoform X2 [Musa acuminata subsp. malaccensis]CAG1846885.1 unnamed protein product [Musa acuminata subsp. malaccensis]
MEKTKLCLVVLLIRVIYAGMQIIIKAAFDGGMNTAVFVFYRQLIATLFLVPVALVVERKRAPALSFWLAFKMFMLALVGLAGTLYLYSVALDYTSTALASAAINSIPVTTFILAVIFRTEKVKVKRHSGIAKLCGAGLCIAGALTIAFYRGPRLKHLNRHHVLTGGNQAQVHPHPYSRWVLGTFLMIVSNLTWSLWLVLQEPLLKQYPSELMFTTLQSLFSAIQTFFITLAIERDFSRWKLSLDMGLISVAYCGIVVTGLAFFLQSWTIQRRGPVFLALSAPLTMIIIMMLSPFLPGVFVDLGSVLGGVLMVGGLYSVLWGKRREQKEEENPTAKDTKVCLEEKEMASPRELR